jgi:hypothetical protein
VKRQGRYQLFPYGTSTVLSMRPTNTVFPMGPSMWSRTRTSGIIQPLHRLRSPTRCPNLSNYPPPLHSCCRAPGFGRRSSCMQTMRPGDVTSPAHEPLSGPSSIRRLAHPMSMRCQVTSPEGCKVGRHTRRDGGQDSPRPSPRRWLRSKVTPG